MDNYRKWCTDITQNVTSIFVVKFIHVCFVTKLYNIPFLYETEKHKKAILRCMLITIKNYIKLIAKYFLDLKYLGHTVEIYHN